MPESTTAESTLQPPVLDNAEALPSPASTQEENDELIYISPVVSSLSIAALMARSNSPTLGHPKFPQAGPPDYDDSGATAMRAAASLRR